jgi:hypothetical protein
LLFGDSTTYATSRECARDHENPHRVAGSTVRFGRSCVQRIFGHSSRTDVVPTAIAPPATTPTAIPAPTDSSPPATRQPDPTATSAPAPTIATPTPTTAPPTPQPTAATIPTPTPTPQPTSTPEPTPTAFPLGGDFFLNLIEPAELDVFVESPSFEIVGQTRVDAVISVNDDIVEPDEEGIFTYAVTLEEDVTIFEIVASVSNDEQESIVVTVVYLP